MHMEHRLAPIEISRQVQFRACTSAVLPRAEVMPDLFLGSVAAKTFVLTGSSCSESNYL